LYHTNDIAVKTLDYYCRVITTYPAQIAQSLEAIAGLHLHGVIGSAELFYLSY
jgi:hypothetical protein